jgi:hypothetical protein
MQPTNDAIMFQARAAGRLTEEEHAALVAEAARAEAAEAAGGGLAAGSGPAPVMERVEVSPAALALAEQVAALLRAAPLATGESVIK